MTAEEGRSDSTRSDIIGKRLGWNRSHRLLGRVVVVGLSIVAGFTVARAFAGGGPERRTPSPLALRYQGREYVCTMPADRGRLGDLVALPTEPAVGHGWLTEWASSPSGRLSALYREEGTGGLRSCPAADANLQVAESALQRAERVPVVRLEVERVALCRRAVRARLAVLGDETTLSPVAAQMLVECGRTRAMAPLEYRRAHASYAAERYEVKGRLPLNSCALKQEKFVFRVETGSLYFVTPALVRAYRGASSTS